MSTNQSIPKSARDILLSKVGEFVAQAVKKKDAGATDDALSLYQRAIDILQALVNNESDPEFKTKLEIQLQELSENRETLTEEKDALASAHTHETKRDSTTCQVVLSLENISIHQITGLGEQNQHRRLLGKGMLRILRCEPPPESKAHRSAPNVQSKLESDLDSVMDDVYDEESDDESDDVETLHLLQLIPNKGDDQFQFPLAPSIPCLCMSPGYYVFPTSGNAFYGVVFPGEIPQAYVNVFERLLETCCTLRKVPFPPDFHPVPEDEEKDEKALTTISTSKEIIVAEPLPLTAKALSIVSSGINTGAAALVEGITAGSQMIAATARTGGAYIRKNITPSAEPAKVPEPIVSTVYVAGKLSPVCVAVSKVLISSLASLADEIGKTIANGITKSTGSKEKTPDGPTTAAAKQVGKTSLQAFVNVWDALEQAGALLLNETSAVTVSIVETKYGAQAAAVTKEGMRVTSDILQTAYNLDKMGVKKIAKKAASRTTKHAVRNIFDLPAPDEKLALPAPAEKLALPAPEEKLALPAPAPAPEEKLALPPNDAQ